MSIAILAAAANEVCEQRRVMFSYGAVEILEAAVRDIEQICRHRDVWFIMFSSVVPFVT